MKYKNNIGKYQSLDAVWSAYPSGGAEGDYCVIDGVIYAWNDVEKNWFAPDLTPSARKTQVVYGDMDVHNNLTVGGVLSARVVRGRNAFCGLFTDEASLNRHVPKPYVGQWALCLIEESNDNAIGEVYMCTADGTWTDAGFRGGFDGIMEVLFGESDARKANDNALLEMIEQVIVSLSEDYYNKREVDHLLEQSGIDVLCLYVDALPSTPSKKTMGKLYFVPAGDSQNPDRKDEYITVFEDDEYRWKKVGSTDIDLSDYYTKEEVYNKSETYSKNETNQTVNAAKEELYGAIAQAVDERKKTRYIPFDLRGESIIFLSNEDMVELFGEQSLFDLTVNQYQHVYRVTNSKSEVFEIPAAYNNANGVRKIVGINGNLTLELTFTMGNDTYMNAALQYRETSIPAISYDEAQDLRPSQQRQARENIGVEVDGKIPTSLLPASVMDEVNNGWLNPTDGKFYKHRTGVEGSYVYTDEIAAADDKIYVDKATNKNYRWGGQSYIPIGSDLTLGETSETAFAGDRGKELERTAIKTTEQSLSAQQKAQARTNIAAVSYDQQSLSDAQKVQAQNNMLGKAYSSVVADHSGLGKVYLAKNNGVLTQAMMQATNTVYVIQYDYTVHGGIETKSASFTDLNISNLNTPEKNFYDSAIASGIQARIDRATAEFNIIGRQEKYYYVEIQLQAQHALHLTGRAIRLNADKNAEIPTDNGIIYANEDMTVYVGCLAGNYSYKYDWFITLPSGCTLQFDGGSISGGTLVGNHTKIVADKRVIFTGISIDGTWNVSSVYSNWFSDAANDNVLKDVIRLCDSNMSNHVYIDTGTYNVSAGKHEDPVLPIKSNTIVHNLGTIQLASNYFPNYYIFNIENVSNVTFEGGNIIGDRDTHTGTTGEWGMGINIGDAHDITVKNVNVTKCWGDGIYVGGSGNTYNISIGSFTISDCRRQGISVTEVDNATINNGKISKIDGTLPKACIDIEPNANDITRNITLSNLYCDNGDGGRGIILYGVLGTIENINIKSCNIVATYSLSIENVNNISVDSSYVNGTLHVKNNSKNVAIKSSEFVIRYLDMENYESVSFANCRFAFAAQDTSIPSCHMDSCNISIADYVLSVYASTNNCSIESNKYIAVHDSTHKNLKVVSTKGNDNYSYPVKFYNSNVEKLDVEMKDSEETGSFYAYIYGENSKIDVVNLKSEITTTLLCYSGENLVLNDVSFAQGTAEIYAINPSKGTMIIPHGCSRVGTTAERPALLYKGIGVKGFEYFDLTLRKPTYWTGDTSDGKSGWVDATGADVPNSQS